MRGRIAVRESRHVRSCDRTGKRSAEDTSFQVSTLICFHVTCLKLKKASCSSQKSANPGTIGEYRNLLLEKDIQLQSELFSQLGDHTSPCLLLKTSQTLSNCFFWSIGTSPSDLTIVDANLQWCMISIWLGDNISVQFMTIDGNGKIHHKSTVQFWTSKNVIEVARNKYLLQICMYTV